MLQLKELENIFSANSQSPVFPILASVYYKKKLYKYAIKICRLGLNDDPNNIEGLYILAKTLLIQGQIEPAEQTLKNILRICPFHLHSSLLLIYVCEDLHRSKKSLESYVKKIHNFYPSNSKVQGYYKKYCSPDKNKIIQQSNKGKKSPLKSFDYNAKLATITMYRLLYSQKRYDDALALLTILAKNTKNKKFVSEEYKKIQIKLNRG